MTSVGDSLNRNINEVSMGMPKSRSRINLCDLTDGVRNMQLSMLKFIKKKRPHT